MSVIKLNRSPFQFTLRKVILWMVVWAVYWAAVRLANLTGPHLGGAVVIAGWLAALMAVRTIGDARRIWGFEQGPVIAVFGTPVCFAFFGPLAYWSNAGIHAFWFFLWFSFLWGPLIGFVGYRVISMTVSAVDWVDGWTNRPIRPQRRP